MLTTLAPGNVMTVWKLDRKRHVHANRSNMVSPSMLTSIPASRLNQKEPKMGSPNRFTQSENEFKACQQG